jgi:hypothetical protein
MMKNSEQVPLLKKLSFRKEIHYRNMSGPDAFEAPLSHEAIIDDVVMTLLDNALEWAWYSRGHDSSSRGVASAPYTIRPFTLLSRENSMHLRNEMADVSQMNQCGRQVIIVGGRFDQVSAFVDTVSALDFISNPTLSRCKCYEDSVKRFVTGQGGLEVLIYNPGDTLEYILVNNSSCAEVNDLVEEKWGLITLAKEKRPSLWAKKTWRGTWGKGRVLPP